MSSTKLYGYSKEQKLKSLKLIDAVFKEGKSVAAYPLRMFYLPGNPQYVLQAGVGVSKKFFAHAVDRNRIKRLLREAWRLQKNEIEQKIISQELRFSIFINYTGKDLPAPGIVAAAMNKCLLKLEKEIFTDTKHEENKL